MKRQCLIIHLVLTCDVYTPLNSGLDMCNGVKYDDDNDGTIDAYAYFVSKTFPYIPGCPGPAIYPAWTAHGEDSGSLSPW